MIARRARVWRTAQPPLLRMVPPAGRAALLDYAEAVEGVLASGGSAVPEGVLPGGQRCVYFIYVFTARCRFHVSIQWAFYGHFTRYCMTRARAPSQRLDRPSNPLIY